MAGFRVNWDNRFPAFWGGLLILASGVIASVTGTFAAGRLPLVVAELLTDAPRGGGAVLTREAIYAVSLLLPLTCLLGTTEWSNPGADVSPGRGVQQRVR